jgi:uncharacterized surface protein with fasciclin (FAS1) repeats
MVDQAVFLASLVASTVAAPALRFGMAKDPFGDPVDMGALEDAVERTGTDGASVNRLWFNYVSASPGSNKTGGDRCGEIDAAPRMPASLFELQNVRQLASYAGLTTKLYFSLGMDAGTTLKLGRCKKRGYCVKQSQVDGISWTPTSCVGFSSPICTNLMDGICKRQCGCEYPSCPDQPDNPSAGTWCSLCGPKYNGNVKIQLYNRPNSAYDDDDGEFNDDGGPACGGKPTPAPPTKTIVDLAIATPELSTLLAALKAGGLVATLSGAGPFTVFAPTNEAFAALPSGALATLLKPENKAKLVEILTYHVVSADVQAETLEDGQLLKTVEGESVTVRLAARTILINSAIVTTANVEASNGVVHIIDGVLLPSPLKQPVVAHAHTGVLGDTAEGNTTNHLFF